MLRAHHVLHNTPWCGLYAALCAMHPTRRHLKLGMLGLQILSQGRGRSFGHRACTVRPLPPKPSPNLMIVDARTPP